MSERGLRFRGDHGPTLGAVLTKLKQEGCVIVVAGESRIAREAMSQRLFGAPDADRHRVLVTPSDDYPVEPWLPNAVPATAVETVTIPTTDRSAAATSVAIDGLDRAVGAVESAVAATDDELDPAVLRLGVHTVASLVDTHGREQALEFLRSVFEIVHENRGMGHVHLGVDTDDPLFGLVDPFVDATVEVRLPDGGSPEQRWYIPEYGYTDWVLISPRH